MQKIEFFELLAKQYNGFILDLWGVIHDGADAYPGAVDCLQALCAQGKPVVLLSNAPRPAAQVEEKMEKMGVSKDWYQAIITSGEAARVYLQDASQKSWGKKYFFVGLPDDEAMMENMPFARTQNINEADWVLCAGYDYFGQAPEEQDALLAAAKEKNLPMLCINPDIEVVRQTGEKILCAGHLAKRYEALGGAVDYIGKPHPYVYDLAFKHFEHLARGQILAVGDGHHTDIVGANQAGIPCVLVTGGILKETAKDEAKLVEVLAHCGAKPDYVMPAFNWQ